MSVSIIFFLVSQMFSPQFELFPYTLSSTGGGFIQSSEFLIFSSISQYITIGYSESSELEGYWGFINPYLKKKIIYIKEKKDKDKSVIPAELTVDLVSGNIVKNEIVLKIGIPQGSNTVSLKIFSVDGKIIRNFKLSFKPGYYNFRLSKHNLRLKKGVYFLVFATKNEKIKKKIVVTGG